MLYQVLGAGTSSTSVDVRHGRGRSHQRVVERPSREGNDAQECRAWDGREVLPREAPHWRRAGQSRSHRPGREEEDEAEEGDPPVSHQQREREEAGRVRGPAGRLSCWAGLWAQLASRPQGYFLFPLCLKLIYVWFCVENYVLIQK